MELYRTIEKTLDEWIETNFGLIVYGARQVGKTHLLKTYLNKKFKDVAYLNLYENISAIEILLKAKNTDDFLLRLSSLVDFTENKDTVIFIDEIQEYYTYIKKHNIVDKYYDIITGSKFVIDRNTVRVVFSGSLLRLSMENIISQPMGYLLPITMYPLDFYEFALAHGVNKQLLEIAKNCFINKEEVPSFIHEKLSDLFKLYYLIGGMPKAVSEYIDTNSFTAVKNAHTAISYYIDEDITKYASDNETLKIKEIYKLLPTELSNPTKRFIISHIPGHKKEENEQLSFSWLEVSGVAIPSYVVKEPVIPLLMSSVRNQLKLFHEDVGLLTHLLMDDTVKQKVLNGDITINYGSIVENTAAQLLHAHGFKELYYYSNKKYGEVDFVIEKHGEIIPIEIKSGKGYKRHVALNNLKNIKNYSFKEMYVFHENNYKKDGIVHYFPMYLIEFLRKE